MIASERKVGRGGLVGALVLVAVLGGARAQGPSLPPLQYPALPNAASVVVHVVDLEAAPPAAQPPIVQLVHLGAYPLTPAMEALPNAPLDGRTAAYLLVNLFAPGQGEQFPVPPDAALALLANEIGTPLAPDAVLTAGGLRDLLLALLALPAAEDAALRASLDAGYPALAAGNPGVPLTRAGAALMLVMALEHLTA